MSAQNKISSRYKYPRTCHLPWSPGVSDDDLKQTSVEYFNGKNIVVTEKMDGENTTLYSDYIHARSLDSRHHVSRNWVKRLQAEIGHQIPDGWRICGENVYAKHSIFYACLDSYFYMFSVWNEHNRCLSWSETIEWSELLGLSLPRVFYRGIWDELVVKNISFDTNKCEGYVVRIEDSFKFDDFSKSVAKWVRSSHVQTDEHWMQAEIVPNQLVSDADKENS